MQAILIRMAKRGYNIDTIRGGASDWDVSRPFTSYGRLLFTLLVHPVRFFEVLPRVPDPRAPGLFLQFCGVLAAVVWFFFGGLGAALFGLIVPLPISLALAAVYFVGTFGGRFGYAVTWRVVAYPLGFGLPLLAVPVLRWVAVAYFGVILMSIGLWKVREIGCVRSLAICTLVAAALILAYLGLFS